MTTLILATRNRHKMQEIQSILPASFQFLTLQELPGTPDLVEDQDTFAGNAARKSLQLAEWMEEKRPSFPDQQIESRIFVLADDSGLEVDALGGQPGVHSARFAALDAGHAGNSSDAENNAKLLRLLATVPAGQRTARFRCVLAVTPVEAASWGTTLGTAGRLNRRAAIQLFEGVCEGRIEFAAAGQHGFGYDPLFVPRGFERTFAQLGDQEKNRISHRSKALERFRDWLLAGRLAE